MKNTILSEKDSKLLEKVIVQHGRILNTHDLMAIFKEEYTKASAYNRINLLVKAGWLRRIKKGLFLVIDSLSARFTTDVSLALIANSIMNDSYVSLTYALNFYHMFDQYSKTITSMTCKKNMSYEFDGYTFNFSKVRSDMFFGFTEAREGGKIIRIAEAEKALIDLLYLDKTFGGASLVFEKIRDYHDKLDLDKLQNYALKAGLTMGRKIGFMMDKLELDADKIYRTVKDNRSFSRLTADAKLFNAKWRLYYDDRITG